VADVPDDAVPQIPTTHPDLPGWDFQRWYGPASPLHPTAVSRLFAGTGIDWWVVGGWSLEPDPSRPRRHHEDIDVAVRLDQVDEVRAALSGFHLWQTFPGLRPVLPAEPFPAGVHQLWVRRDAWSPWLMDLALTPVEGPDWVFRPDPRVRRPLADAVQEGPDGVPYQVPEIGLLFKARHARAKDTGDLHDTWPRLAPAARDWLREALSTTRPGHPWLAEMT
jgi:hypothetical protein